ncbi:uncharacterized protein LOC144638526 [Oculina patagonica]
MSSPDSDERPSKRARVDTDFTTCVICSVKAPRIELVTPKDQSSWVTLRKAAEMHKFEPILQLPTSNEAVPAVYYHRECRSAFTHKKTLNSLQSKIANTVTEDPRDEQLSSSKRASSSSRVYQKICIFCDKGNKYIKRSHSREPLIQASELRADEKVRAVATAKRDSKILTVTSRELVAAEAHYHKTCYRDYTREYYKPSDNLDKGKDGDRMYADAEDDAYQMLFANIREELFSNPRVLPMVDLTGQLVLYMKAHGVEDVQASTKKHIRRKLEGEFGESLLIFPDDNGKLLIIPDNLKITTLAAEQMRMKGELKSMKEGKSDPLQLVKKTALYVRDELKKSQDEAHLGWPPEPHELDKDYLPLTPLLTAFLQTLVAGDTEKPMTSRVNRFIYSVSQDCMFAVSGGSCTTAKHILLPWAVKTLTGNVEVIKLLNRLGHGVSYSKLEEIETALCMKKIESDEQMGVMLPSNIYPGVPTTLAFDNIDRLEETLSGGGTSHRVNGIVVQPMVHTVEAPTPATTMPKQKKRSIEQAQFLLPSFNAGERVGPPEIKLLPVDSSDAIKTANMKNFTWCMARQINTTEQNISGWTGFNIMTRDETPVNQDTVGYLPTINAPATAMSTVNEVLNQALKIKESLHLKDIVCVFDQAMYAKAAEITWKHPDKFQPIVLRMGAFHTICNFLAVIGKRFLDAGLRDLAVESEVITEGSVDRVLNGQQYNRGIRLHKLVFEALQRLAWKGFLKWFEGKQASPGELQSLLDDTRALIVNVNRQKNLDAVLNSPRFAYLFDLYQDYLSFLRTEAGHLAQFWMSYMDMVETLLHLIRSSREGNWMLHLYAIRAVLPWCFAYDRVNYSRYLSVYYTEMTRLSIDHPDVHVQLENGGFSVQLGTQNPFGRIPVDQTIEETVNKDTQTAGGTKGFSLKPAALSRYYLTAEHRSTCLKQIRELTDIRQPGISHHDLESSRIRKDEAAVQSILDLMENEWINPFSGEPTELISLSTATVAPADVATDLLTAKQVGETAYKHFQDDRVESRKKPFHDPLPKQKLKTFSDMNKPKVAKGTTKEAILKADHKLFGHMVLIATSRKLDMSSVLAHPLGPLPWSLGNCDGTLKKTSKATLARQLEKNVSLAEVIPRPSACVIDGMSLVQKAHGENKTFGELSEALFVSALRAGSESYRVDVVFDVYKDESIKNAERVNRGSDSGLLFGKIVAGHKVKQWRRLLSSSKSKTNLIKFLAQDWQKQALRSKLHDKVMYITCENTCFKLTSDTSSEVPALSTTQEEADTRMLLHANHAAEDSSSVIIASEDTDVLIICLSVAPTFGCHLFIKCGTQNRERFVDVLKVAAAVGHNMCSALPGMHAFTGCDTVSAFGGKGKISALKLVQKNRKYQDAFSQLGKDWSMSSTLFSVLQEFTCKLYANRCPSNTVNDLRYQLFRAKKGEIESGQLPPCQDCLFMHSLRANYQAGVWRRALETCPRIPNPIGHGWCNEDGNLAICWMTGSPAPDVVIEFLSCKCTSVCKLPNCQCLANGLKCTTTCRLQDCNNWQDENLEGQESDSEDSSGDED